MTDSEIGRRLRQIRKARGKSLAVVAGLAGITAAHLSRLETGERALDRRSLIADLANALGVSPSELTDEMITAPGELSQDDRLPAVRQALMAVSLGVPDGNVVPVEALRTRVDDVLKGHQECRSTEVGDQLPALIRDIHTTLDAHREEREVLRLVTLLHLQGTGSWLWSAGGTADLVWLSTMFAQSAAERLDEPLSMALSAFGATHGLMAGGSFDLAGRTLAEAARPGTATREATVVSGMLTLTSSLLSAARGDTNDRQAALDEAADLAATMGDGPEPWFGFGPTNVDLWRLSVALESAEYGRAVDIAARINPDTLPSPFRRATYWINYGRAIAKQPKQRDKAVRMLRTAEKISPARLHRHPLARETLSELLYRTKQDAVGRELRGMAYRAGLPV